MKSAHEITEHKFLAGGGELGMLIRSFDWSKTSVGNPHQWPQSLRTTLSIILSSKFPMFLWWGADLIQFYNDAYRPSLGNGGKHPMAVGQKAIDCWPEIWTTIKPLIDHLRQTGESTWNENQLIPIFRNGHMEDVYWTFSYSPVQIESGEIGGVLVTVVETTEKVKAENALKESEHRFQNLVREANVGIIVLSGEEMRVDVVNDAYGRLIGLKSDDLLSKHLFDVIPDAEEVFRPILDKVRLTGESVYLYDQPYSVVTNGKKVEGFLNIIYQAYKESDGTISGVVALCHDITETTKSRDKIAASEKRYSDILTESVMAIGILKGPEMIVSFANEPLITSWRKGKDIIGKSVWEIMPEMKDQDFSQQLQKVYTTGVPYFGYEVKTINIQDGIPLELYYNFSYQPYTEEDNTITGVTILATEVTEQVLAKKQIEASEAFNRTVLESSPDCVKVLDNEGRIQFMNFNGLCQMEIDDFSAFKNKNWWTLWGTENEALVKASVDKALKGETAQFTALCLTAKGTTKWWDVVVSPVGKPGEPVKQIISVSRDITQKKEADEKIAASEKQFRTFADSIQNLAWIAKADGWIYWYNQQWYDYTGTTLEEMEGLGWQKVHHPDHIEKIIALSKEIWKKDEAFELTFPLRRHDGEYRWFLTRAYPVKDSNGNIERWIGTNTDVDDQRKALDQKDEFMSIASHEMKTPLTAAKAYLQLLEMSLGESNSQVKSFAKKANHSVERLNQLIVELLDVSKIQEGKINYNFAPLNFNELVESTVEDMQYSSPNHKIIKTGKTDYLVTGDKNRLEQVLINLLSNAIKYSPDSKDVYINIEEAAGEVKVIITDTGIGMNKRNLQKIFERYYRAEDAGTKFQGLGIGLYISNEIIQRHQGKMWAESEPGKGSAFYFTIPV